MRFCKIAGYLPEATIIVGALKIPDMIFISGADICEEEDFRCQRLKEARLAAGTAGVFQAKKYRYGLDMEGF